VKSITVLLALALFTSFAVESAIRGETTLMLPDGRMVVVPVLQTSGGFDDSFRRAYAVFSEAFAECPGNSSTGLLWSVAECLSMVCPVSTNDFTRESLAAIKKDDQLIREGKIQPSPVLLRRRTTPNVVEVARKHRLLKGWNVAVIGFRRRLLVLSSETLKNDIGKQRYLESFIEKARLSSDEKCVIQRLCEETSQTNNVTNIQR